MILTTSSGLDSIFVPTARTYAMLVFCLGYGIFSNKCQIYNAPSGSFFATISIIRMHDISNIQDYTLH